METPAQQPAVKEMPPPAKEKDTDDPMLTMLAYPVSAAAGYLAAETQVHRGVFDNLANHGEAFADLKKNRHNFYGQALRGHKAGKITSMAPAMAKIETDYRAAVKERFKELGMPGMRQYWQGLQRTQKVETLDHFHNLRTA